MGPAAALLAFHLLILLAFAVRAVGRRRRHRTLPSLEGGAVTAATAAGDVSVIIPARNEGANLGACLAALHAIGPPVVEILVVDDQSEDDTSAVAARAAAEDGRVRVLAAPVLPRGWTGKNHALHHGAAAARSPWLLFVDADVRLAPDAVTTTVGFAAAQRVDLLSLSPRQHAEGFWERLLQALVFDLLDERFDLAAVNDPARRIAAANGQFLLFRRTAYAAVGGHAAVRGAILEDVALAHRVKSAGLRLHFAVTRSLAETRMYRGFGALAAGWTKNLALLLGPGSPAVLLAVARRLLLWVVPLVTVPAALLAAAADVPLGEAAALAGLATAAALVAAGASLLGRRETPVAWAPLVPLGQAVVVALALRSWLRHTSGRGVTWKGRTY